MSYENDTDGNMVPTPEAARLEAERLKSLCPSDATPCSGSSLRLRSPDEMIMTEDDVNLCRGSGELLPCPFCGSRPLSNGERTPNGKAICWKIFCTGMDGLWPNCGASVWGTDPDQSKAREMAVARWNKRTPGQNA